MDYDRLKTLLAAKDESDEWWDEIWKFLNPFIGKVADIFQSKEAEYRWGEGHAYDAEYMIMQLRELFLLKPETEAYKAMQAYIAIRM